MLVYAPVREEDLNALDRALREKEPADCSLDQRKVFDEKRAKVVAAFKARFNAPIDFLASVDEYRRLFSRKRPWLPALELLATAGCEGTQTIQRGLRVRDLCLANKEQEDSDPTDSANGKALRPLTRRLDGGTKPASKESDEAAALIGSALSAKSGSVPVQDVKHTVKAIITARFGGQSPEVDAAREEFIADLAAEFGLEVRRLP
jgi:hypothetical protein